MKLQTIFCGVRFPTPLVLASGIMDCSAGSMLRIAKSGAGGITTKSVCMKERKGHRNPTIIPCKKSMINAVGLSGQGIKNMAEEIKEFKKHDKKTPIILSIFGGTIKEFGDVAKSADETLADIIEANISCPNVEDEFGTPFAGNSKTASKVTKEVKKNTSKPVSIKLSPQTANIGKIARAVEKAGADAITAINTAGPSMMIDTVTRKPMLSNIVGGLSGPGLKPLAVGCVYIISKNVKIPIIGTGGVVNVSDAKEMILAGASLIGIGSALYYKGIEIFGKINKELKKWKR